MISPQEFSFEKPEVFTGIGVAYGETRRDPEGIDPISGNTSQSPSLRKVYDWLEPREESADAWVEKEQRQARLRLELLYRSLASQSTINIRLAAPAHGLTLIESDGVAPLLAHDAPGATRPVGDAIVTREPGAALLFNPADCPIINLAYYRNGFVEAIAQIHAGAKGVTGNIIGTTLQTLDSHSLTPTSAIAYVGPHSKSYSLYGAPLEEAERRGLAPYLHTAAQPGHKRFDMGTAVVDQLTEAGVLPGNIEVATVDTASDPHYYSQREQSTKAAASQAENPSIPPFARNGVMFVKR